MADTAQPIRRRDNTTTETETENGMMTDGGQRAFSLEEARVVTAVERERRGGLARNLSPRLTEQWKRGSRKTGCIGQEVDAGEGCKGGNV